jgi:hypothetical protein
MVPSGGLHALPTELRRDGSARELVAKFAGAARTTITGACTGEFRRHVSQQITLIRRSVLDPDVPPNSQFRQASPQTAARQPAVLEIVYMLRESDRSRGALHLRLADVLA